MTATCKLGENGCWNDGKCRATSNCENKVVTNADRIRSMTDEELAEFLGDKFNCSCCPISKYCSECRTVGCYGSMMVWLQQPAEE